MELKAYLSVLLVKELSFSNKVEDFQRQLKRRFNKDYDLQSIEDELLVMKLEQKHDSGCIKEFPEFYNNLI